MFSFLFEPKNYLFTRGKRCFFLLSKYTNAEHINRFDGIGRWETLLDEKPSKVVKFLIFREWLRPATIEECVASITPLKDIKEYLKKKGLKISGKKETLLNRIREINGFNDFREYKNNKKYYILTESGKEKVRNFESEYNKEEDNIIIKLRELLSDRNLDESIKVAGQYVKYRYFESSILSSVDYTDKDDFRHIKNNLISIMDVKPKIFDDMNSEILLDIRLYIAISYLIGSHCESKLLSEDYDTHHRYNITNSIQLLKNSAYDLRKINEIEKGDTVLLTVSAGCRENPCDYYNNMYKDKTFELKRCPDIPNPNCPLESGCRCSISVRYL